MSLEAIEMRILADARAEAERIIDEAQARAADIASHAADNGQRITEEILAEAESKAEEQRRRALGMAGLERRKELLQEKRYLLDTLFESAIRRLNDLPADDYFSLISAMITQEAPHGDKELLLSETDLARLPTSFMEDLNKKLVEAGIDGELRLSPERRTIRGGFMLKCGGLEFNGTFERLITGMRSKLEPGVIERLGFDKANV
jgi:V/A-type H+-transporting ATPase subunit E